MASIFFFYGAIRTLYLSICDIVRRHFVVENAALYIYILVARQIVFTISQSSFRFSAPTHRHGRHASMRWKTLLDLVNFGHPQSKILVKLYPTVDLLI